MAKAKSAADIRHLLETEDLDATWKTLLADPEAVDLSQFTVTRDGKYGRHTHAAVARV